MCLLIINKFVLTLSVCSLRIAWIVAFGSLLLPQLLPARGQHHIIAPQTQVYVRTYIKQNTSVWLVWSRA